MRVGLLSTARINRKVIEGAAESDEVEVAAVASRDPARADAYAREHGIATAHGSYEALLADPSIDAVYISLPNGLHCDWSMRSLEAGKHVLCEKPMSTDPSAVAAVFDVAEARGLVCMEAFMWRHNPQTRRLEALVAGGAIGELRVIRSDFGFTLDPASGDVRLSRISRAGRSLISAATASRQRASSQASPRASSHDGCSRRAGWTCASAGRSPTRPACWPSSIAGSICRGGTRSR